MRPLAKLASLTALSTLLPMGEAAAGPLVTAYSVDQITNLSIASGNKKSLTVNSVTTSSEDTARLKSAGDPVTNTAVLDPKAAAVGGNAGAVKQNNFDFKNVPPYGPHLAASDAQITKDYTGLSGLALVNLSMPDTGSSRSVDTLRESVTLAKADKLTISFTDTSLLDAFVAQGVTNAQAAASHFVYITIFSTSGGSISQVFKWLPDGPTPGAGRGVTGGTDNSDPFSLVNRADLTAPGGKTIDPPAGNFSATTNQLAAGDYTIYLSLTDRAFGTIAPEPSTFATAGTAVLMALGYARRRRRTATAKTAT